MNVKSLLHRLVTRHKGTALISLTKWSEDTYKKDKNEHEQTIKEFVNSIKPRHVIYADFTLYKKEVSGDKRVKAMLDFLLVLDKKGYKRSWIQLIIHKAFLSACLKKFYGDDIYRNMDRILSEFGLETIPTDVIVIIQRRGGKTIATSGFGAGLTCTQPDFDVMIYSIVGRTCRKLLSYIYLMIVAVKSTAAIVSYRMLEQLEVNGTGTRPNIIMAIPGDENIDAIHAAYLSLLLLLSSSSLQSLYFEYNIAGWGMGGCVCVSGWLIGWMDVCPVFVYPYFFGCSSSSLESLSFFFDFLLLVTIPPFTVFVFLMSDATSNILSMLGR